MSTRHLYFKQITWSWNKSVKQASLFQPQQETQYCTIVKLKTLIVKMESVRKIVNCCLKNINENEINKSAPVKLLKVGY